MFPHSITSYLGASSYLSLFSTSKAPLQHKNFHFLLHSHAAPPVFNGETPSACTVEVQGKNSLLTTYPTKPSSYLTPLLPSHTLQQNSSTKSQTHCPSSLPRSSFHHITAYSSPEEPHSHTPTSHHHPCTHVQPQPLKPRVLRIQSSRT